MATLMDDRVKALGSGWDQAPEAVQVSSHAKKNKP